MKLGLIFLMLFALVLQTGCGKGGETASVSQTQAQHKADEARASLQEKADALAREASMNHKKSKEKSGN